MDRINHNYVWGPTLPSSPYLYDSRSPVELLHWLSGGMVNWLYFARRWFEDLLFIDGLSFAGGVRWMGYYRYLKIQEDLFFWVDERAISLVCAVFIPTIERSFARWSAWSYRARCALFAVFVEVQYFKGDLG